MDGEDFQTRPALEPLAYHKAIAEYLRKHEAEVWAWTVSHAVRNEQAQEVRAALLRETYRLDPSAHADVHADCAAVMTVLELDAPVALYQATDGAMNAALYFIPGEAHLVFHGPVLERLTHEERIALIGHELAHYKLWSVENGAFHVASQILDHALAYPGVAPSHAETARLYRLHTELYADRGAALAAGKPAPAIATLIKTMTGLSAVDTDAYLRQAAELDEQGGKSEGATHPEIFLRAQALDKWWRGDKDVEQWLESRIRGRLSMQSLDLERQQRLEKVTRGFLAQILANPAAGGEAIAAQVRRYFPDWDAGTPIELGSLSPEHVDDSVREYLFALCFDLAMADPESKDELLRLGAQVARGLQAEDAYRAALARDLRLNKRAISKLLASPKGAR